jgi:hypothetical protein
MGGPLTVSVDEGSTQYLFVASPAAIESAFKSVFPEANVEREFALHSSIAGTSIDIFVNLATIAGGIASAELTFLPDARRQGMWIGVGTKCLFVIIPLHQFCSRELLFSCA